MTTKYKSWELEKSSQKRKGYERGKDEHLATGAMSKIRNQELKKDDIYQHEDENNAWKERVADDMAFRLRVPWAHSSHLLGMTREIPLSIRFIKSAGCVKTVHERTKSLLISKAA